MESLQIENILSTSGLSCEDLISKLLAYKQLSTSQPEGTTKLPTIIQPEVNSAVVGNKDTEVVEKHNGFGDDSVINIKNCNEDTKIKSEVDTVSIEAITVINNTVTQTDSKSEICDNHLYFHVKTKNEDGNRLQIGMEKNSKGASEDFCNDGKLGFFNGESDTKDGSSNSIGKDSKDFSSNDVEEGSTLTVRKITKLSRAINKKGLECGIIKKYKKLHYFKRILMKNPRKFPFGFKENSQESVKEEEKVLVNGNGVQVRSELRQQLELLRTPKVSHFVSSTVCNSTLKFSKKKVCMDRSDVDLECSVELKEDSERFPTPSNILKDILLNNDSIFKIVDVKCGADALIYDEKNNNDVEQNIIKTTKTNDITKIKGWKHKKFIVPDDIKVTKPIVSHEDLQVPSCSYATIPELGTAKNAFASTNLEGFLEDADLAISYNIPKLNSEASLSQQDDKLFADPVTVKRIDSVHKQHVRKPRTVAEKRMTEAAMVLKSNLTDMPGNTVERVKRNSILYNGTRKIRIFSKSPLRRLYIGRKTYKTKKRKYQHVPMKRSKRNQEKLMNQKLSLLHCLNGPAKHAVNKPTFSPGPLSRKNELQVSAKSMYKTVIKRLPEVKLEVRPELGKPMDPRIENLIGYNTYDIDENRMELALSALSIKNSTYKNTEYFSFPATYKRNQENLILYEKVLCKVPASAIPEENDENISLVVNAVVSSMLNYVETKEIEESLLREDESCIDAEENTTTLAESIIPSKKAPRNKTTMELKRLNVQVIEVDIEEEKKSCNNAFCRLGCVCNSLNGVNGFSDHCGKIQCMFKCSCKFQKMKSVGNSKKVVLPPGTDLLSEGTVSRLQEHVQKDLAKIEKEFSQTVIQANNQTIIVGSNGERQRRVSKVPNKHKDFVDGDPDVAEVGSLDAVTPCFVVMQKLDLSHIIPLCLIHNIYDCNCLEGAENEMAIDHIQELDVSSPSPAIYMSPIEHITQNVMRTARGFKRKLLEGTLKSTTVDTRKKRKQSFDNIKRTLPEYVIDTVEPAIQRRKKKRKPLVVRDRLNFEHPQKVETLFDQLEDENGCAFKESEPLRKQFLAVLGKLNEVDLKFRLLSWSVLAEHFNNHNLCIWYSTSQKTPKLLVTESQYKPTSSVINIRNRKKCVPSMDIIEWLLDGVPANKKPERLMVMLTSTKMRVKCWELCGICQKPAINTTKSTISFKPSLFDSKKPNNVAVDPNYKVHDMKFDKINMYNETQVFKVSLPYKLQLVRWRMLHMNSNFSLLNLQRYKLQIKYSDLLTMSKTANQRNGTIVLVAETEKSKTDDVHGIFGVYAVPEYDDKIFIGPYGLKEEHDFDTLRYANGVLVNTDIFHKMQGTSNENISMWMYTTPVAPSISRSLLRKNCSKLRPKNGFNEIHNVDDDEFEVIVEPTITKTNSDNEMVITRDVPHATNRRLKYVITNIPDFGYIEVYTFTQKRVIDICFPETEGAKKFVLEQEGLDWLKKEIERYIIVIPFYFQLELSIVADKPAMRKLQIRWLQGCPIVGTFGAIQNLYNTTKDLLLEMGLSVNESAHILKSRLVRILKNKCFEICKEFVPAKELCKLSNLSDYAGVMNDKIRELNYECINMTKEKENLRKRNKALETCKNGLVKQIETKMELDHIKQKHIMKNPIALPVPVSKSMEVVKSKNPDVLLFDALETRRKKETLTMLEKNSEILIEKILPTTTNNNINRVVEANTNEKKKPVQNDEIICIDLDSDEDDVAPKQTSNVIPSVPLPKPLLLPPAFTFKPPVMTPPPLIALLNMPLDMKQAIKSGAMKKVILKGNKISPLNVTNKMQFAIQGNKMVTMPMARSSMPMAKSSMPILRRSPMKIKPKLKVVGENQALTQKILQQESIVNLTDSKLINISNAIVKSSPIKNVEYKEFNNCVYMVTKNDKEAVDKIFMLGNLATPDSNNLPAGTAGSSGSSDHESDSLQKFTYKYIDGQLRKIMLYPQKKNSTTTGKMVFT